MIYCCFAYDKFPCTYAGTTNKEESKSWVFGQMALTYRLRWRGVCANA